MSTIAIDTSSAEKKQRTGVEEYSFQLIERLKELAIVGNNQLVLFSRATLKWPFKRFWLQGRVTWELLRRPPNMFFVPAQALPFFILKKIKVVTTIHDLGFSRRPDLYPSAEVRKQISATKRAVRRADLIFTPSEFTKQELIKLFQAKAEKITVTPLAADTSRFKIMAREEVEVVIEKYRLGYKNYFLFVSRIDVKKNPLLAIRAFEEVKNKMGLGDPLRLVFAGPPGYRFEEVREAIKISSAKDFISGLGYVPTEDLPALTAGALALISPSYYEGFGLPLLEAAVSGTPVIAADLPVYREVMGEAARFVPLDQPEAWPNAMLEIAKDPNLAADFSAKGLLRAKIFSWPKTADQTWTALTKYD